MECVKLTEEAKHETRIGLKVYANLDIGDIASSSVRKKLQ